MSIPIQSVREVARLLQESGLHEIVIESSDGAQRLKLRRDVAPSAPRPVAPARVVAPSSPQPAREAATPSFLDVFSTAVGVYRTPPVPLQVGDEVKPKQVIAIVESLKIPTEITAPARSRVVEILAQPQQGVEYGQILLRLEPILEETA